MSDKENLIVLLESFGVEFEKLEDDIRCEQGMYKVEGYPCFYVLFKFDSTGKFEVMEICE